MHREDFLLELDRDQIKAKFRDDGYLRNYYLNLWEYKTGQIQLETYPWHLILPIADICNARCTFCNSWLLGKGTLRPEQLDPFIPLLKHAREVGLHGHGEPLINPNLSEILPRIRELIDPRCSCFTITNGRQLADKFDLLRKNRVTGYCISLNAASAMTHDKVMALGPDAFSRIVETIQHLTSLRDNGDPWLCVVISFVLTKDNLPEAAEFIRLGNELRVNQIEIRTLQPLGKPMAGLNYHLLPPFLHPGFERYVSELKNEILQSPIRVRYDSGSWQVPVFPREVEEEIRTSPPKEISRREAQQDKQLREGYNHFYGAQAGAGMPLAHGSEEERRSSVEETAHAENPLGRQAHFLCGYVYHYFMANELNFHIPPCCFLYEVPGFESIIFDGTRDFMEYWNSPAYQALRRSLKEGPLFRMCKICSNQGRYDL